MKTNGAPHRCWVGEKLFTFRDLSRELIRNPEAPVQRSHWSLRRWAVNGAAVNGSKKRIKLACKVMFGARYSSVQAVNEFWCSLLEASQ